MYVSLKLQFSNIFSNCYLSLHLNPYTNYMLTNSNTSFHYMILLQHLLATIIIGSIRLRPNFVRKGLCLKVSIESNNFLLNTNFWSRKSFFARSKQLLFWLSVRIPLMVLIKDFENEHSSQKKFIRILQDYNRLKSSRIGLNRNLICEIIVWKGFSGLFNQTLRFPKKQMRVRAI